MRIEIAMPRLSDSMSEGTVTAWFRNEGEAVAKGDTIAEIETEKSTVDLTAPDSGVLVRIAVAAGAGAVPVGAVLAEIDTDANAAAPGTANAAASQAVESPLAANVAAGTSSGAAASATASTAATAAPPSPVAAPVAAAPASAGAASAAADETVAATPLARRMAAQAGLALSSLTPTGIGGKICRADVEAALGRTEPAAPAVAASPAVSTASGSKPASLPVPKSAPAPMSRMRRTIAERMARAKATIPHFYLSVECRVDRVLAVRETLKADGVAVSVNDFVLRASALALKHVPAANASWIDGQGIVWQDRVDIAVAVALDDGLVTPVVRGVDSLGLATIAATVRDLATRARQTGLAPHEYDGATFTVSNLGMHGVGQMFAIVNPPQACILGVGAAEPKPVVEDGKVVVAEVLTLSLSADHRVLDGVVGAKLLDRIRRLLEEPSRMLA